MKVALRRSELPARICSLQFRPTFPSSISLHPLRVVDSFCFQILHSAVHCLDEDISPGLVTEHLEVVTGEKQCPDTKIERQPVARFEIGNIEIRRERSIDRETVG